MKKKIYKPILLLILILSFTALILPNIFKSLKFGLDLQGGFEVLYQVKSIDGKNVTSDMITSTYKTMLKRIDVLGVSEPEITIEGDDKIRVQLAGVMDQDQARSILSQAATLTFRDSNDNLLMNSDVLKSGGAKVGTDSKGMPAVSLAIADKDKFYNVTKRISSMEDNLIVIWLDFDDKTDSFKNEQASCGSLGNSRCLSAATVSEGFASDVIIQGNFTQDEVKTLVDLINSGSLPTKLEEISSKTVMASFGEDSLNKTFFAGFIGVILVMLTITIIYRFAGFVSSIGLLLYTVLTFAIFWLVGGVLTLPGIAAVLLGIGMAVDANVLNFSRIKDELRSGSSLQVAFKKGNANSLKTIIDANVTTLLVAIILFVFGESSIKGFATMLMISIFTTMLVMVIITRYILKLFVQTEKFDKKVKFFIGNYEKENKKINYINLGKKGIIITSVCILIGVGLLFTNKLNLGIDFKGGSVITINSTDISDEALSSKLEKYTIDDIDRSNGTTTITITDNLNKDEISSITKYFNDNYNVSSDISVVTNIVKRELIKNAIFSVILSIIGIIIYLTCRFKFSYGISSVVALLHDVFMIIAIFSLLKLEVSTIFIAAILSIIGYSINNTIVVFDRIRENLEVEKIKEYKQLQDIVDKSIKETILRSVITSLTTIFPVIALIIFGSHEIFNFNIALLIGLIVGTYSSLFLAPYLWLRFEKNNIGKPKKKKWYEEDTIEEKKVKGINY